MTRELDCKRCGCKRAFVEREDYFVCSTCGEKIDLPDLMQAYSGKFYMAATILFARKREKQYSEDEDAIPLDTGCTDEPDDYIMHDEDNEVSDGVRQDEADYLLSDYVSEDEKAQYCKRRFLTEMLGNYDHEAAIKYCELAAQYDKSDPYILLLKGLGTDIPIYTVNSIDFSAYAGDIDRVKVCLESSGEGVLLEQEAARKLFLTPTIKAWMSILADYEAALACCDDVEQCEEIGILAAMHLNLVETAILYNELKSVEKLPTAERTSGYRELQMLLLMIHDRFASAIKKNTRGPITLEVPNELLDAPDWNRYIHRAEGYTANRIFEKFVIPYVDVRTQQISKKNLVNFIDSLSSSHTLFSFLQGYFEAKREKDGGTNKDDDLEMAELIAKRINDIKSGFQCWTMADSKGNILLKNAFQIKMHLGEEVRMFGTLYMSAEASWGFDETDDE